MSDWLNISTNSGSGDAVITVTASTSEELESRIKHLKVSTITKSRIVEVKQLPRNAVNISISPTYIAFNARGTIEYTITVNCDGVWEITDYPEWLNIETLSGNGYGTFVVTADPNRGEMRQGEIRVSTRDTYAICIAAQEAYSPWLILSENEVTLSVSANTFPLEVDSSSRWNATLLEEGYGRNAEEEFLARYTIINLNLPETHNSPKFFIHDNRSTYRTYYIDGCVSVIVDGVLYSPEDWYITLPTLTSGEHTIWVYSTGNAFNAYALHDFLYYHPDDTCSIKFADNITNVTNYTEPYDTYQSPYIYTSITFSDNTRSVNVSGSRAEELNFPSGLTYLAANSMTALTSVTFDEKTTELSTLYIRKTPITELKVPRRITSIDDSVLEDNPNLVSITFPETVDSFNATVSALTSITSYSNYVTGSPTVAETGVLTCPINSDYSQLNLPSGWTINATLPNNLNMTCLYNVDDISGATKILNSTDGIIKMSVNGAAYVSPDTGYTFSTTGSNEVIFIFKGPDTDRNNLNTVLRRGMLSGVSALTNISFNMNIPPCFIDKIPNNFASGATGLKDIDFKINVRLDIGDSAFRDCSSLFSLSWLPNHLGRIGNYAFCNCGSLMFVDITDVEFIDSWAFGNCTGLTHATLPNIPNGYSGSSSHHIYAYCSNLSSVDIKDGVNIIPDYTFYDCNIIELNIPDSVERIGEWAFYSNSNLIELELSEYITSIGWGAFRSTGLINIVSEAIVCPSIGGYAFADIGEIGTLYSPAGSDYTEFMNNLPSGWINVNYSTNN